MTIIDTINMIANEVPHLDGAKQYKNFVGFKDINLVERYNGDVTVDCNSVYSCEKCELNKRLHITKEPDVTMCNLILEVIYTSVEKQTKTAKMVMNNNPQLLF